MARRRYGRRRRHAFKIPVLSLAILGGQAALAISSHPGNIKEQLDSFQSMYTGFDITTATFHPEYLAIGWAPWFVKGLVSKVARGVGARPKVPFGLPFSIS